MSMSAFLELLVALLRFAKFAWLAVPFGDASPSLICAMFCHGYDPSATAGSCAVRQPGVM